MRRVDEERITMLPGAPAIYQTILDHPDLDQFDLSTLRLAVTGAATVPVEMVRRMASELTFKTIVTGYGLTESTGIATMCRHTDDPETIANTAGRPIPDVEVLVVGDDGTAARPRRARRGDHPGLQRDGRLLRRRGRHGRGDRRRRLAPHRRRRRARRGAATCKITDRTKDMFVVGGFNAYPAEIENMLMAHPSVGQVAVIGVPDHRMGEVGRAYVVPRAGATVDEAELIAWAAGQMANYKVPRSVEVVDALPLNATGKVLKYVLRERAAAAGG